MRIIHDLYLMCCEKRFKGYPVEKLPVAPRVTLYKYLVIPKEGQPTARQALPPSSPQTQQPKTPNYENRPTGNPFAQYSTSHPTTTDHQPPAPPEVKRRTVHTEHEGRPRSNTLPFVEHTEELQPLSTTRSGTGSNAKRRVHHPKHDQTEEEEQQDDEV
jgi:hypothetical protein